MSTDQGDNAVAVTRRIDAPAPAIFAYLCDPANHPTIDGSGMVRFTAAQRLSSVGDTFAVEMWNEEMGEYEMTNLIVEYEPDRLIRWQPGLSRASRPEDVDEVGNSAYQRWGFELTPVTETVTDVTETFDCIESPDWLKNAVKGGERWIESMTVTLDNLATQVEGQ
jgi:uncharacterized protein YndB with AHSA1/START domain